jgi:hypothetical protein
MEQKTHSKYATGIFLTKRKSKTGKEYLELSIKKEQGYDKFLCFESDKKDQFGNQMFSVMIKEPQEKTNDNLPF